MSDTISRFDSRALLERLRSYPEVQRYLVGFSGGADSTALLTALHDLRASIGAQIEAVHFNHRLQEDSGLWQEHCERFCATREIPLYCHALDIRSDGVGLEASAREARYRQIESDMCPQTIYLTGHNADDRAETFLLHALRGSGPDGLASIPEFRALGPGYVARPLLDFSRRALTDYLEREGVGWIEDPSNLDIGLDRNFVRWEVIPLLEKRWPAARESLARCAGHLRSAATVLQDLLVTQAHLDSSHTPTLSLAALERLGQEARGFVMRAWLRTQGVPPMPESRLAEFLNQLKRAAPGAQCETAWAGWAVRLFRHELRIVPPDSCPDCPERIWDATPILQLGPGLGALQLCGTDGGLPENWCVAPRRPGTRIRLHTQGPRRKLKKVFQEQAIPPWQRQSIPVLYWGEEAVAIGDWLLAPCFEAWLDEHGLMYRWDPEHPELRRFREQRHDFKAHGRPA